MDSGLFKVNLKDVIKSVIGGVVVAVLAMLYGVVIQAGFDVFTADWVTIGKSMVNTGFIAFMGVLSSLFLSDRDGDPLGMAVGD